MAITTKHVGGLLAAAAAAWAVRKYMLMSDEEKEKFTSSLKDKVQVLKEEATSGFGKAKDYISEISSKGTVDLKDQLGGLGKMISSWLGYQKESVTPATGIPVSHRPAGSTV
ncbi:hypothetical protein BH09BAC2_BH09BAC2_04170 [soil metagenome]